MMNFNKDFQVVENNGSYAIYEKVDSDVVITEITIEEYMEMIR